MSDEPFPTRYNDLAEIVERGSVYANDTHELLRELRRQAKTSEQRARAAWLEATWLDKVGRDAEALIALDTARGLSHADELLVADVLALRACILARAGQLMAASEMARAALEKNPAHVEARLALAQVAFDVQEPRRALKLYHEALPLLGDRVERAKIHLTIARAYRQLGLPVLARTHARAALSAEPHDGSSIPIELQAHAVWLRASSLPRVIRWLTVLAVFSLLLSGLLGGMTWTVAGAGAAAVLLVVGLVAWFTTPAAPRASSEDRHRRTRREFEEQEEPVI